MYLYSKTQHLKYITYLLSDRNSVDHYPQHLENSVCVVSISIEMYRMQENSVRVVSIQYIEM